VSKVCGSTESVVATVPPDYPAATGYYGASCGRSQVAAPYCGVRQRWGSGPGARRMARVRCDKDEGRSTPGIIVTFVAPGGVVACHLFADNYESRVPLQRKPPCIVTDPPTARRTGCPSVVTCAMWPWTSLKIVQNCVAAPESALTKISACRPRPASTPASGAGSQSAGMPGASYLTGRR